ncbi:MAG: 3-deoxy-D-manno-octulosonic acid transferase [Bacteroidetes bacterium]|nr:3-deoxy-D-manno-octulosonic acid transferase [Bacteroidota bacterium]
MLFLYNLSIRAYGLAIQIAALFNDKAKLWVRGRKNIFDDLRKDFPAEEPIIWMHCASLGEFEQGRPLIEELKKKHSAIKILLTFYSPSGYEIRKEYPLADWVYYLPLDTPFNAKKFIFLVRPSLVIFVKYEFWYHFLNTLSDAKIPVVLISAIFRPKQLFFKWYGGLFRRLLSSFYHIFLQNASSAELLKKIGIFNFTITGDTRIDRVNNLSHKTPENEIVKSFSSDCNLMVCGSTWLPDEEILIEFINKQHKIEDWKFVFAPHDIASGHLKKIENKLKVPFLFYSKANTVSVKKKDVLIVDNIGLLSSLYRYGKIAYIGGGFGAGIHNTLEPAAFGLPIIFGPKFQKFEEANTLVETKGAFTINNLNDFEEIFQSLEDKHNYELASTSCQQFISKNIGASKEIIRYFEKHFESII